MNIDEFTRMYEAHADRIFGFLAYRTGDRDVAEDLLADVFERALRRRHVFDRRRGTEDQWLYAIAVNLLRDRHRRKEVEQRHLAGLAHEADEAVDPIASHPRRATLLEAVAQLPAAEREVVALRYGADLTGPQIARVLGVPGTTVDGRLHRAMGHLRTLLGHEDERP